MTVGGPQHEVWLTRPDGRRIGQLPTIERLEYTKTLNDPGSFTIVLPGSFRDDFLQEGYRVEIWYTPEGGAPFLDFFGLIHKPTYATNEQGLQTITITGQRMLGILGRRIVVYDSGTSQANKTDYADDMIKAIVRENFGASAGARAINSAYFSVAGDTSQGVSVSKKFSRRNVLEVCQEIAAASFENGTPVYFDFTRINDQKIQLQTFINFQGTDQRANLIFSLDRANLKIPVYELDYSAERNVAYVGGQGQGEDRNVIIRTDATRAERNIWSRKEAFADQRNTNLAASLNSEGDAVLREGKPRKRFSAELVSTGQTIYGKDWRFGDRVTALAYDQAFESVVRSVTVIRDNTGYVSINARLEVEE
jgi:hypothetical protein